MPTPNDPRPRAPRDRMWRRLALVMVLLSVLPIGAIGFGLISTNEDALERLTTEQLYGVIEDVRHAIGDELARAGLGLDAIANAFADDAAAPADRVATVRRLVAAFPNLPVVAIYDQAGALVDTVRRAATAGRADDATPVPAVLPEALRTAARGARTFGELVRTPAGARLPIVQVIGVGGGSWYAYAPVSFGPIDDRLVDLTRTRFKGNLNALFIVDGAQRIISHGNPELAQLMPQANSALLPGLSARSAERDFLFQATFDTAAGAMIGMVRPVPQTPFAVVAQLPHAVAFASIGQLRGRVIGVMLGAALLAALAAIALARRVSRPVERLVAFSHQLAARQLDATADVHTGDELEVLGDALTAAARALAAGDQQLIAEAQIRADLGRYLPSQLVDKIVRREQSLELGGRRRTVTVLFADVASFTTLTESYPPDVVASILNELFTILTEIVFRHGGTVDKYIGDCVMAFWNAPDDQPDHAARAVAAAQDMLRWLEIGNEAWQAAHGVTIRLAIGLNTGEVVVGNFGSKHRMTYTCIGDAVNVAARLEGIARPQQILVARATHDAAPTAGDYHAIGAQTLSGRLDPIEVYEVIV
jgi:adenylate cyclase